MSLHSQVNRIAKSLVWLAIVLGTAWAINRTAMQTTPVTMLVNGDTMGTTYSIRIIQVKELPGPIEVKRRVDDLLNSVNSRMSTYIPESDVGRFNDSRSTDWFPVDASVIRLCKSAQGLSQLSDGAYDITVGPMVDAWGFGPKPRMAEASSSPRIDSQNLPVSASPSTRSPRTGNPRHVPSDAELEVLKQYVGFAKLEIREDPPALRKSVPELRIDLSSIAQGYGVDCVAELLSHIGFEHFFVEISGEIRTLGQRSDGKNWRVGIEKPVDSDGPVELSLGLSNQSIATSGDYRNYFLGEDGTRYSHTIDPKTGKSVQHTLASASVVADTCTMADGIATTMMALGPEQAMALAERENWKVLFFIRQGDTFRTQATGSFRTAYPEVLATKSK